MTDTDSAVDVSPSESPGSNRRIEFEGGTTTVLVLGVAFAAMAVAAVLVGDAVAGTDYPAWVGPVAGVGKFALFAGLGLALLRVEGVSPVALGLSKRDLRGAILAVAGVYVALNGIAVALATATGSPWGIDVLLDQRVRWPDVPAPLVVSLLFDFLVVALVEEFVFRGYLQSKVVALVGAGSRLKVALAVLTASLAFGFMHAPGAIVAGASPAGVAFTVMFLSVSGAAFGTLYELTHNIYFVALLHAIGNTWVLVADIWSWSGPAFLGSIVGVGVVYAGAVLAYRYWASGATRRDVNEVSKPPA